MQLGKFHPVELPIWGELGAFCEAVMPNLKRSPDAEDQITELALEVGGEDYEDEGEFWAICSAPEDLHARYPQAAKDDR